MIRARTPSETSRAAWALCLLAACSAALAARPYSIVALEPDAGGKLHPAQVLEQTSRGVTFQIRFLDPSARRAAIRSVLGRDLDLLPPKLDEERIGYLVFVVQVANGSPGPVEFNPGQARLTSEKGDHKFAMDYSALFEVARSAGAAAPSMDELAEIFHDRPVTIAPGGSSRKLLAFEHPRDDRFKRLEVKIVEVNIGAEAADFTFPFRKQFED